MGADEIVAFVFVLGIALSSLVLPILALLFSRSSSRRGMANDGHWPW